MRPDADRLGRWQHLDSQDESLLLSLAESPGDLGDLALSAMTHLPLRIGSWGWVQSRLENLLSVAETPDRRRYLEHVLRWVPPFEPEDVVEDAFQLPTTGLNRPVRNQVDAAWMQTPAPGCVLLSDVELSLAAARSESRLRELHQLAEAVIATERWHDADHAPSIDELDRSPRTAVGSLSADGRPVFAWGNPLVAHVARCRSSVQNFAGCSASTGALSQPTPRTSDVSSVPGCSTIATTSGPCAGWLGRLPGVCRVGASRTW